MPRSITAAGKLVDLPEYYETPSGKQAVCAVTVTTKHRDPATAELVDDPPIIYELIVTDEESLAAVAALARGDRVLFSGLVRDEAGPPRVDVESAMPADRRNGR